MEMNSLAGYFSVITDVVLVFLNRHHHTTANASTATNNTTKTIHYYHIMTHAHTTKHNQTQTPPNTTPISSTDTGLPNSKWHDSYARTVVSCMMRRCSLHKERGHSPRTLTLRPVRAVFTERDPTGRVIIVLVAERKKTRKTRQEKEKSETSRERRERERRKRGRRERRKRGRREREGKEREGGPPCVGSKRLHIYRQNARMCSTYARFVGMHGGVLNLHTRGLRVPSRATHTTDTTHHTLHTNTSTNTTHNDTAQHTTDTKTQNAHPTHTTHCTTHHHAQCRTNTNQ